jgi:hypothetical protein
MSSMTYGTSCLIVLPCCTQSTAWHRVIGSPSTVAVPYEWSTGPTVHYSHIVPASPHVLHALNMQPTRTSCMPIMALTSGALETCVCALETHEPSCIGRPSSFYIYLRRPIRNRGTRGSTGTLPDREAGSEAIGHAAMLEPTSAGRWGPEPQDSWQRQSPPQPRDEVWSHRAHGSIGAHLNRELRSRDVGHVVAPEPIPTGWQRPGLKGTW